MRALLLSAYDAPSHRYWHQTLSSALTAIDWTTLSLPARYFNWRIRSNSLYWAHAEKACLQQPWDFLLATSMVDLTGLRALLPSLAQVPTALYFHENQFAYPVSERQHSTLEPRIMTLYSALCADRLVFNSRYNRDTFLQGVRDTLSQMPDFVPAGIAETLQEKSQVIPVPLDAACFSPPRYSSNKRLHIIWSHRWEYDKNPELLLAACEALSQGGRKPLPFVLHVTGQQFRHQPPAFAQLKQLLEATDSLGSWGFIPDRSDYLSLLQRCDLVLSTARHDFQGLSVLEAVAAGCLPLVPAHQVYPEWFPSDCCYPFSDTLDTAAAHLAQSLQACIERFDTRRWPQVPSVASFALSTLAPVYQQMIKDLMAEVP